MIYGYKLFFFFLIFFFFFFLIFVAFFAVSRRKTDFRKLATYECGFQPLKKHGNEVNVNFFFMVIIFMLFDVELLLLYPIVIYIDNYDLVGFLFIIFFFYFLIITFVYEYVEKLLKF